MKTLLVASTLILFFASQGVHARSCRGNGCPFIEVQKRSGCIVLRNSYSHPIEVRPNAVLVSINVVYANSEEIPTGGGLDSSSRSCLSEYNYDYSAKILGPAPRAAPAENLSSPGMSPNGLRWAGVAPPGEAFKAVASSGYYLIIENKCLKDLSYNNVIKTKDGRIVRVGSFIVKSKTADWTLFKPVSKFRSDRFRPYNNFLVLNTSIAWKSAPGHVGPNRAFYPQTVRRIDGSELNPTADDFHSPLGNWLVSANCGAP